MHVSAHPHRACAPVVSATRGAQVRVPRLEAPSGSTPLVLNAAPKTTATIICPECEAQTQERMPTDACQFFYVCTNCRVRLRPLPGDCCVFCSYSDSPCPSRQGAEAAP